MFASCRRLATRRAMRPEFREVVPSGFMASVLIVAVAVILPGCSLLPPTTSKALTPATPVNAPTLPFSPFRPVQGAGRDIGHIPDGGFASDGTTVVSVGSVRGNATALSFHWSNDDGATWRPGALTREAQAASTPNEAPLLNTVAGGGTWLALGRSAGGIIAWTSGDGQVWDRHDTTGLEHSGAWFGGVATVAKGFVLAGRKRSPDGSGGVPCVWTSSDGIAWSEKVLAQQKGVASSVTTLGTTIVAVGDVQAAKVDETGRIVYPQTWISKDQGQTWSGIGAPEPRDSTGEIAGLTEVVGTSDGLIASGYYNTKDQSRPYALKSADGAKWTVLPAIPQHGNYAFGTALAVVNDQPLIGVGELNPKSQTYDLHLYRLDGAWTPADPPDSSTGFDATSMLAVNGSVLLGVRPRSSLHDGTTYRSSDVGKSWQAVSHPAPAGMKAWVAPFTLAATQDGVTALGVAQGATAMWTSTASGFSDPTVIYPDAADVDGVTASPTALVAWSNRKTVARLRTSVDGGKSWTEVPASRFVPTGDLATSTIQSVSWLGDRWVMVGNRTRDGNPSQGAMVFTSVDAKTWVEGKPATSSPSPEWYEERFSDLLGAGDRGMVAAAALGSELITIGTVTTTKGPRPAYWTSSQGGTTWAVHELPISGVPVAEVSSIVTQGKRIVAAGRATADNGTTWVPATWTSPDGGKNWTFTQHPEWREFSYLTVLGHGSEVLVVLGSADRTSATVWRSSDAATWSPTPVTFSYQEPGIECTVQAAVVQADAVVMLVRVANRLDAASVLESVALT